MASDDYGPVQLLYQSVAQTSTMTNELCRRCISGREVDIFGIQPATYSRG